MIALLQVKISLFYGPYIAYCFWVFDRFFWPRDPRHTILCLLSPVDKNHRFDPGARSRFLDARQKSPFGRFCGPKFFLFFGRFADVMTPVYGFGSVMAFLVDYSPFWVFGWFFYIVIPGIWFQAVFVMLTKIIACPFSWPIGPCFWVFGGFYNIVTLSTHFGSF